MSAQADLVARLHNMATCIYIAVEETVADDISDGLTKAAAALTAQQERIAELEREQVRVRNLYDNVCTIGETRRLEHLRDARAAEEQIRLLRDALTECADRLETCAIISGGNTKEVAAMAVEKYRALAAPIGD